MYQINISTFWIIYKAILITLMMADYNNTYCSMVWFTMNTFKPYSDITMVRNVSLRIFLQIIEHGVSLVAQWSRICLPMQVMGFWSLIWEDSTCLGATLESITTNNAGAGDGIPVELFQILEDDAVKVLHSICQQIWKTQQWPQD